MNHIENEYKIEIDGLKGVAILGVIFFHINEKILPSGFLGVDIFFVISGFLITKTLSKKKFKNFFEFLKNFYKKRITRIYPTLIVYVVFICLIMVFLTPDFRWIFRTGASSLLGVSNILFIIRSTDYFADSVNLNPFSNTWFLGVETQFYIFSPILFWFFTITK